MPLKVLELNDQAIRALYGRSLVLIRPDQHVAWRGDVLPSNCLGLVDIVRGAASYREVQAPVKPGNVMRDSPAKV